MAFCNRKDACVFSHQSTSPSPLCRRGEGGGTQKSGWEGQGATTHSHRPPDWIWALAVARPGHQTSDCALASRAGRLAACAGRRGAGAPRDMAATSLHKARGQMGRGVGCLSEGGWVRYRRDGFKFKVGESVGVRGFNVEMQRGGG